MTPKTHVKWVGPNDPMITVYRNDARLYLTKRELLDLRDRITGFIEYYKNDFSDERVDIETLPDDFL